MGGLASNLESNEVVTAYLRQFHFARNNQNNQKCDMDSEEVYNHNHLDIMKTTDKLSIRFRLGGAGGQQEQGASA
jgi:hypothetical protein